MKLDYSNEEVEQLYQAAANGDQEALAIYTAMRDMEEALATYTAMRDMEEDDQGDCK